MKTSIYISLFKTSIHAIAATVLAIAFMCLFPALAHSLPATKVKVGWVDNSLHYLSPNGVMSGFSFEVQEEVANHTGWEYEYAYGSWTQLMSDVVSGKLDMLPFVTKTPEREKILLFSEEVMNHETYSIYTARDRKDMAANELSTLNGKRIGVVQNSYQEGVLREWLDVHKVKATVVYVKSDSEAIKLYTDGKIDAWVGTEIYQVKGLKHICSIGASDVYFVFNKERADLKEAFDKAMSEIEAANPYFLEQTLHKFYSALTVMELNQEQKQWIKQHENIKVGYIRNNLPYSAYEPKGDSVIGALATYISKATALFSDHELHFSPVPFSTHADMIKAAQRGDVDCVFPYMIDFNYAKENHLRITHPLIQTTMFAITADKYLNEAAVNKVAVVKSELGKDRYIEYYYPHWKIVYYDDIDKCEKAVRKGDVDCIVYSAYQAYLFVPSLDLFRVPLTRPMMAGFGIANNDITLLNFLNQTCSAISSEDIYADMTKYAITDRQITPWEILKAYFKEVLITVLIVLLCFICLSVLLYLNSIKLKKAVKEAEHARQVQERFLQNMSHELRTPLNSICGFSQILSMKEMRDCISDEELDEYGKIITSNTEMLTTLVSDILDISDFESGKYKLLLSDTDINEICRSSSYMVSSRLPEGVNFRLDTDVADGTMLYTDKRRVCQVITNFLTNAYKHTTQGEVILGVSTTLRPGYIAFSVTDTGMGVPAELQDKIFERFEKGISSLRGIGLGLNICSSIAEALQGDVYLDRDYTTGARFIFLHPTNLRDSATPNDSGVSVMRAGNKVTH